MGVSCYHLLMTSTCSRRETGTRFCTCAPSNYVCVHTCACVFSSNKTEKSTKQKRTIFPPPQGPSEIQPALDCLLLVLSEWYSLLHGQKQRQMILVLDKKKTFITRLSHLLRAHVCVCFHMYVGACVCVGAPEGDAGWLHQWMPIFYMETECLPEQEVQHFSLLASLL